MLGLMQDFPLIVPRLLTYAETFHHHTEIALRTQCIDYSLSGGLI
jgi:hypothetical protein